MSQGHPDVRRFQRLPRVTDPARLAALDATGLVDAPAPSFDKLTRLAAAALKAPIALMSLVGADRQTYVSRVGTRSTGSDLSRSFCKYVVEGGEALIVDDARTHPLVRGSPAVEDGTVGAYAGFPVTTPEGHVLGSFCVIDRTAREWSEDELQTLRDLAACAISEVELHLRRRQPASPPPPPLASG